MTDELKADIDEWIEQTDRMPEYGQEVHAPAKWLLERALAKLQGEWVSVTDGVPREFGKEYLTYWTDETMEIIRLDASTNLLFKGKMIGGQLMTHWGYKPLSPPAGGIDR